MTQPLPAPIAGVPFDVETAAGRVSAYELGEGQTVLLLHSFNAAGSGIELAPLASRLAEHRRVVLVDWLGFGTSDRPDAPYGWALFGEQLERIRLAALQPGETSVDVVALSLPGQYVVVAAAEHPERFGRIVLISPTGFGRFKGDAGPNLPEHLSVPAPDRDRPPALRGPRSAPGDPLVPSADLRGSGAGPTGVREVLLEDLPAAARLPCSAGLRVRVAQRSSSGGAPTSGSRTRHSSSSGIIRASPTPRPQKRSSPRTATWNGSRSSTPATSLSWSSGTRLRP